MYKLFVLLLLKINGYFPNFKTGTPRILIIIHWFSMTNTRALFHIVYTLESTWMVRIMCDHGSVSWYFLDDGTDSTLTLNSDLQSRDGSLTRSQLFHCLLPIVRSLSAFNLAELQYEAPKLEIPNM